MPDIPDRFTKESFLALDPDTAHAAVRAMAVREAMKIRFYDEKTVYVEKQSFHPDDWYLWAVVAQRLDGSYDVWTLNLTTGSMAYGHYCLNNTGVRQVLAMKKGVDAMPDGGPL